MGMVVADLDVIQCQQSLAPDTAAVAGSLRIISSPGMGTTATILIPKAIPAEKKL